VVACSIDNVRSTVEDHKGNRRTGIGHVLRIDRVTPEADPTLTDAICVVDGRVTII
jgi:hypothetical protein